MPAPTKIQHPLLDHPGMSQRKRNINLETLRPEFAKLDDRSMVEMLLFIHGYARNVIFHDYKVDPENGPYSEISNWIVFFENSLPFQLARFSAIDPDAIEVEYDKLATQIDHGKTANDLLLLFDFIFYELFTPVDRVWQLVNATNFAFLFELNDAIDARMVPLLKRYATLRNTAAKYLCIEKLPYETISRPPWKIPLEDAFLIDSAVREVPGGEQGALAWFRDELTRITTDIFRSLRRLVEIAPSHIEDSLNALEKRNEPHLGLLFAFIRLYTHFQDDLNNLSVKHLNYFYENVLRIKAQDVKPDTVHLIFEIANHLNDGYLIEQGTVFRDGKDDNGIDIDFVLDESIVIDKAQVANLRTLIVNLTISAC